MICLGFALSIAWGTPDLPQPVQATQVLSCLSGSQRQSSVTAITATTPVPLGQTLLSYATENDKANSLIIQGAAANTKNRFQVGGVAVARDYEIPSHFDAGFVRVQYFANFSRAGVALKFLASIFEVDPTSEPQFDPKAPIFKGEVNFGSPKSFNSIEFEDIGGKPIEDIAIPLEPVPTTKFAGFDPAKKYQVGVILLAPGYDTTEANRGSAYGLSRPAQVRPSAGPQGLPSATPTTAQSRFATLRRTTRWHCTHRAL
jgi:hypothetical protein